MGEIWQNAYLIGSEKEESKVLEFAISHERKSSLRVSVTVSVSELVRYGVKSSSCNQLSYDNISKSDENRG